MAQRNSVSVLSGQAAVEALLEEQATANKALNEAAQAAMEAYLAADKSGDLEAMRLYTVAWAARAAYAKGAAKSDGLMAALRAMRGEDPRPWFRGPSRVETVLRFAPRLVSALLMVPFGDVWTAQRRVRGEA